MDDSNNDGDFGGAAKEPTKAAQGNTSGAPLSKADKSTPAPSSKPTTGDSSLAAQRGSETSGSSSSGSASSTGTGESGGGAGSGSSSGSTLE